MSGIAIAPGREAMPHAVPQRIAALERANRVRLARAELKRRVAAGTLAAADVIRATPWEATRMPVAEILTSQRRWGTERSRRCLGALLIPENKHIGTLTDRQREVLAAALETGG
jgi:hypothetical protein